MCWTINEYYYCYCYYCYNNVIITIIIIVIECKWNIKWNYYYYDGVNLSHFLSLALGNISPSSFLHRIMFCRTNAAVDGVLKNYIIHNDVWV